MRNKANGKARSDRPSGRQASEQPEHNGNTGPAPESLHQGQGPDLITQDSRMQEKNKGMEPLDKNLGFQQAGNATQQPFKKGKVDRKEKQKQPPDPEQEDV
jgi:hypothetical protein